MSQQLQITGGAKVRDLNDVIIGTSGVLSSLAFNVANGVPKLDSNGKILVSQLPNSVMEYKGTWDASTNTPTLVNGTGNQGDVYLCNVAGTVNFGAGAIAFFVGDQVIYSGSIWQRASGATGTVTSVAVTETGDSLNITGSPITTSGTINIGFNGTNLQYVNGAGNLTTFPILTGYVPYTGATTDLNLGANLLKFTTEASDNASIGTTVSGSSSYFDFNLSDDNNQEEWRFRFTPSGGSVYDAVRIRPVSATASDLLVSGSIGAANFSGASGGTNTGDVTLGTANGLSLASQVLSLAAASASVTGALTSSDWSSFNSKVSSQWTTSGSDIFYNTGNVCVNTTTSGTGRFFVAADTDSGITIRNTGTADRFQLFVGSTGGATYTADNAIIKGTNTAIDFYNGSTATKKVTIPNSGNYLEVYGDAYVQSYVKIGNGSGNYTALTTIASGTKIVTFPNATGTVALTSDIPSTTGFVPYTGATQDVDLGAFKLNAQSLHAKGTAGNGHLGLKHQSASATASANEVSLFADSLGDLSWQNGNLYLSKFITSSNTAARSYTFPNANGTVALTSDFSGYVPYTGATTNLDMGANGLYANNLTIRKISTSATIDFPNTGTMNDPAFIKHTESPDNTAVMSFSVGDNDATNDYFVFGNASSGFVERFKITATGVVTIGTWNGTAIGDTYISSAATWNGKVSSVSATSPVVSSGGTTPTISIPAATTSVSGYLTSTDWNTFNNKQSTITNPVTGTGNTSYVPKFSSSSAITDSSIYNGASGFVSIGNTNTSSYNLDVTGSGRVTTTLNVGTTAYVNTDLYVGDTTSGTGRFFVTDASNQGIVLRRLGSADRFKMFVGNGTTYTQDNCIILGTNTDIDFYTGSSPVRTMTINNSNKVGIGNPSVIEGVLTIFGTSAQLPSSGTTANSLLQLVGSLGSQLNMGCNTVAGGYGAYIQASDNNLAVPYNLNLQPNGGNVGIGTILPNRLLEVATSGDTYLRVTGNRGNADDLHVGNVEFYNTNTTRIIAEVRAITGTGGTQSNSGQLAFYTNNAGTYAERMRINSNGTVNFTENVLLAATKRLYLSGTSYIQEVTAGTIRLAPAGNDSFDITSSLLNVWVPAVFDSYVCIGMSSPIYSERLSVRQSSSANLTGFSIGYSGSVNQFRSMSIVSSNAMTFNNGVNEATLTAAGAWTNASDLRLKKDIKDIKYGLDTILNSKPRSFNRIDVEGEYIGFIAQELLDIIPEVVSGDIDTQYCVDYGSLVAVAFKAIQEQQAIILSLQTRLDKLENK